MGIPKAQWLTSSSLPAFRSAGHVTPQIFMLSGATSYQKIITFIAVQRDRLNAAFGTGLRRAPAVNTLRRLFLTLDQDNLEGAFRRYAQELNGTVEVTGKRTIALDGKTLRGSFDHLNDRKAAHVLSAFASDAALILAHQEVAGRDPGRANADHRAGGQRHAVHRRCPALPEGQLHAGRRDRQWPAGPGEAEPAHLA